MSGNPNWQKGQSANPNGRPKGVTNASTESIKRYYMDLLDGNLENIQDLKIIIPPKQED